MGPASWFLLKHPWQTEAAWYDTSWQYRKKITFNNSAQSSNLSNFPVMIKLTSENFQFDQAFRSQTGREPTLIEKINLFKPENRTVRYLLVNPRKVESFEKEINQILEQLEPNDKIVLNGQEVLFIYDLQNLKAK